jgi:hypothetical protein
LEQRETLDEVSIHQPVLGGEHHWFEDQEEDMDQSKTLIGTDEDQTQQGSRDSFESPGVSFITVAYAQNGGEIGVRDFSRQGCDL